MEWSLNLRQTGYQATKCLNKMEFLLSSGVCQMHNTHPVWGAYYDNKKKMKTELNCVIAMSSKHQVTIILHWNPKVVIMPTLLSLVSLQLLNSQTAELPVTITLAAWRPLVSVQHFNNHNWGVRQYPSRTPILCFLPSVSAWSPG